MSMAILSLSLSLYIYIYIYILLDKNNEQKVFPSITKFLSTVVWFWSAEQSITITIFAMTIWELHYETN